MSAVASETALRVLQNQILFLVIQSTSNSSYPAEAEEMTLQLGTRLPRRALSNGRYGPVPKSTRTASQGPSPFASLSAISAITPWRSFCLRTCGRSSQI
jgi:hypothetical protein